MFSVDTNVMGSSGPSQREKTFSLCLSHTHRSTLNLMQLLYDVVYLVGGREFGVMVELEKQGNKKINIK